MTSVLRSRGLVLVGLTALVSGVSTFVNFWAVQGTNSDAFVAMRNGLVAILLVPGVLLAAGARESIRPKDWLRLAAIGLVGGAIPFILFFRGLQLAGTEGAATASFGYRALFLVAGAFAVVALRERFPWRIAGGAVLILGGNLLLLSLYEPVWTDGFVLVMGATGLWAAEYTISKRILRDLRPGTVALGRMGFGAAFLVGYLGLTGGVGSLAAMTAAQLTWMALSAFLLLAFVSTWYAGLRYVDVATATSVLVLGLPITLGLSVLAGRSALAIEDAAGIAAVVAGVGIAVGAGSLRETWSHLAQEVGRRIGSRA